MYYLLIFAMAFNIAILFSRPVVVDFVLFYSASLFLFSLPLMLGYMANTGGAERFLPATDELLAVYAIAFVGNAFFSVFYYSVQGEAVSLRRKGEARVGRSFIACVAIFCFFYIAYRFQFHSQAANKRQALEGAGILYMVAGALVLVGFTYSTVVRAKVYQAAFLLFASVFFLWGSRSVVVFCFLSWLVVVLSGTKIVLIKRVWLLPVLLAFYFVVSAGKSLYAYAYAYNFDIDIWLWLKALNSEALVRGSEFLTTNGLVKVVMDNKFSIPSWSVPASFMNALPLPGGFYPFDISYFSNNFQSETLGWVNYGVAFNPWAEAYAWMGYFGVAFYSVFLPFMAAMLSRVWMRKNAVAVSLLVACGVVFSFWVQRNTLGSIFAYLRNIMYPALLLYFLSSFMVFLVPSKGGE